MNRILPWLILIAVRVPALYGAEPAFPLWDGHESVADYAKKVNLPPTKTLDLGNGVKLELVLIPAGKFIMGTQLPPKIDEESFRNRINTGAAVFIPCLIAILFLLAGPTIRAIRDKRAQFSLRVLTLLTIAAGGCVLSGMHWLQAADALRRARFDYAMAIDRYDRANVNEKPAHAVTLTKPFYMGKFEVTQEQYVQVLSSNPSHVKGNDLPADFMTWDDACSFCSRVSAHNRTLRLPTEAEWEFACRAGTQTRSYAGDSVDDITRVAWCSGGPQPVGHKEANAFGLHDMLGNVWEWCWDWYGDDYYGTTEMIDPRGPPCGPYHAIRGGSWLNNAHYSRSASRWSSPFGSASRDVGFRVVLDVPTSSENVK